MIIVMFRLI